MAYVYRCSRCRTRNTFQRAVGDYIRPRRCRDCGYQRFYVDRERVMRPMCERNPRFEVNRAKRQGLDDIDIAWLGLGAKRCGPDDPIPF